VPSDGLALHSEHATLNHNPAWCVLALRLWRKANVWHTDVWRNAFLIHSEEIFAMFKKALGLAVLLALSSVAVAELPSKDKLSGMKENLSGRIQAKLVNGGGKCLRGGGSVNTVNCGDAPDQLWRFDNGRLRNIGNDKCLDVPQMNSNGGAVNMWDCNDAPNQQFKLDNGRLKNGDKCVDVPDMNADNGKVQIWDCNDAPNEKWKMR